MTPQQVVEQHVQANVTGLIAALVEYNDEEAMLLQHGDPESSEEAYPAHEVWAIDEWLAERLVKNGGRIGMWWTGHYWARGATGQAIHMDTIIQAIADQETARLAGTSSTPRSAPLRRRGQGSAPRKAAR